MKVVGQGLNRVDAYGKVTGEAKYSADLEPRDILHGKVIHSTIANGLVKSFDLTEALKVPGVVKRSLPVLTRRTASFQRQAIRGAWRQNIRTSATEEY